MFSQPVSDKDSPTVEGPSTVAPLFRTWKGHTSGTLEVQAAQSRNTIGTLPMTTPSRVAKTVAETRQSSWSSTAPSTRRAILETYRHLLFEHSDELLDIIQLETGKTRDAAYMELISAASTARYYATTLDDYLGAETRDQPLPFATTEVQYEPYGTVGVILPWNYPLALGAMDILPALAAGNSVVVKPSELAPYTVMYMSGLLLEAGVPSDALQLVIGEASVGEALVEDVDVIAFTGSTKVGKLVAQQAAEHLTPTSLELGGKNPLLILEDADVDKAVQGTVDASFNNAGQLCVATERAYVHENLYDEYIAELREAVDALSVGVDYEYGGDVGVLISDDQFDRVQSHVEQAVQNGATVVAGGSPSQSYATGFEPTILTDVDDSMDCVKEETFGPVVTVEKVASTAEMIQKANDTDYGLHASIWGSTDRGQAVAEQLEAGTVAINDGFVSVFSTLDSPMGGWKDSGMGRRNGREGIRRYQEQRTVSTNRVAGIGRRPSWFPPHLYERLWEVAYERVPWIFDP